MEIEGMISVNGIGELNKSIQSVDNELENIHHALGGIIDVLADILQEIKENK